jgi:EAL domain-containing protein (putative c-di-GMP-specific phosphodiesterase class I)
VLDDLRAFGIRMALDDFGTGYSGLSHLRRFPVDIVKIDQAFIADIRPGSAGTAIVKAVTELAHELDLSVTAEGVETTAQHEEVVRLGCEHAQGFLYAAPMPRRELSALLAAGNGAPPSLRAPSRQPSASGARRSAVPVPARRA